MFPGRPCYDGATISGERPYFSSHAAPLALATLSLFIDDVVLRCKLDPPLQHRIGLATKFEKTLRTCVGQQHRATGDVEHRRIARQPFPPLAFAAVGDRLAPNRRKGRSMAMLSHMDERGRARMVDVTGKDVTRRVAVARGVVAMRAETLDAISEGQIPKGDVLAVARIAGIMAAKKTSDLVPMCHPLDISGVDVEIVPRQSPPSVEIEATVRTTGRTGVEMEALTAVSVAGLTIYDMCKAVDRGMTIGEVRLVHKSGGKSGAFDRT